MADKTALPRSPALESLHEAAKGLYRVGAIDQATMRRFDVACLTQVGPLAPEEVRRIREEANMSQALFARVLNVTASLVSKWERGEKKPSGPSQKLLALVRAKGIDAVL